MQDQQAIGLNCITTSLTLNFIPSLNIFYKETSREHTVVIM